MSKLLMTIAGRASVLRLLVLACVLASSATAEPLLIDGFGTAPTWRKMPHSNKPWPAHSKLETSVTGMKPGGHCLRITSPGLEKGGRLDIAPQGELVLPGRPAAVGLWVKANLAACFAVSTVDTAGESFGQFASYSTPNQWQFLVFRLGSGNHWGGNDDGVIDYPVRVTGISLEPDPASPRPYVEIRYAGLTALDPAGAEMEKGGQEPFFDRLFSPPEAQRAKRGQEPFSRYPAYTALRASGTIRVDGDLSDWSKVPSIVLDRGDQVVDSEWKGPRDLSGRVCLQWDHDYLYLAADVTDDHPSFASEAATMWMFDSLQFVFGTAGHRGLWQATDGYYNLGLVKDVKEFMALRVTGSEQAVKPVLYRQDKVGGRPRGPVAAARVAGKKRPGGYLLEAAIPWSELSPMLPLGQGSYLFDIIINDNDGTGRKGWIGWTPGIGEDTGTGDFGELRFTGASDLELFAVTPRGVYQDNEDVTFRFFVRSSHAVDRSALSWAVKSPAGRILVQREDAVVLKAGLNTIERKWNTADLPRGSYHLDARLRPGQSTAALEFQKESKLALIRRAEALRRRATALDQFLAAAEKKGVNTQYPRVSYYTILQACDQAPFLAGPDRNRPDVADRILAYSEELEKRARGETEGLLTDPASAPPVVPPLDIAKGFAIRNGVIYNGPVPVILIGMILDGRFEFMLDATDKLPRLGFNFLVIHEPVGPSRIFSGQGEVNRTNLARIVEQFQRARAGNLAVDLHTSDHYFEGVFKATFPDIYANEDGKGFHFNYNGCLDNPHYREVLKRWLNVLIPAVKDQPNLFSYCLGNESLFACSCPRRMAMFREWLIGRYGSLAAVNRTWGTDLVSLDRVPAAYRVKFNGNEFGTAVFDPFFQTHPAAMVDYTLFNQDRFQDWFRYFQTTIRTMDTRTFTHIKHMMIGTPWTEHQHAGCGLDREASARRTDLNGNDGCSPYVYFPSLAGKRDEECYREALFFDLLRSLDSDKPVFNSENLCADYNYEFVPPESYRLAIWEQVLHGQAATLVWQWADRIPQAWQSQYDSRPEMMDALGRAALDIRRLTPSIIPFWRERPQVRILYSNASLIWSDRTEHSIYEWYLALAGLDAPIGFVTERQLAAGAIDGMKVLVVPRANYLPDTAAAGIEDFARRGGTVLVSVPALECDEHGKKRRTGDLLDCLTHPSDTLGRPRACGKGRIFPFSGGPSDLRLASILDRTLQTATVDREIRVLDPAGRIVPNLESRAVRTGDKTFLTYVLNRNAGPVRVSLVTKWKIRDVQDLISLRAIMPDTMELPPSSVRLLKINLE